MTAPADVTTCQVCGRPIKASSFRGVSRWAGMIAHHGYRRPAAGWQTSSCLGARFAPYERSCDRLRQVIGLVEKHLAVARATLATSEFEPPAVLYRPDKSGRRFGFAPPPLIAVTRPVGFLPTARQDYMPDSYVTAYHAHLSALRSDVRGTEATLDFMRERLAAWRAPKDEGLELAERCACTLRAGQVVTPCAAHLAAEARS